jgi:RNA polymerase sigma-70 factor (ECF subfamily)
MSAAAKYEQAAILKLLAQDSEYAFQLVFDSHRNQIYNVALMYLKSPLLAEEVVQDVFLKLWFQRKDLSTIQSLEAWLYTVGKNCILNYLKKISHEWTARQQWQEQQLPAENTADFKLRTAETTELFQKAIHQLSDQQRTIYRLAREEGMSYEAIGRKLSISPLTVKTHMARALASIRAYLGAHGELFVLFVVAQKIF